MKQFQTALSDLFDTLKRYRVWFFLGKLDIQQRYARSLLGPWWISLSMLIFVLAMSIVFSRIFKQELREYIPFFTAGLLTWQLIAGCINEASDLFRSNAGFIKQTSLPYNLYVFKHLTRQTLTFFHNFVVYLLIALLFKVSIGRNTLLVIPALLLLAVNLYWISLFIGIIGARFRDMTPIIANCIQIAFLVTPISWTPKLLYTHSLILLCNPFAYYIDIVRSPLLNTAPSPLSWAVTGSLTILGLGLSGLLFSSVRRHIVFWVD